MTTDLVTLLGLMNLVSPADKLRDLSLSDLDKIISVYIPVVTPEGDGNVGCYQPVLAHNSYPKECELYGAVAAKPVFVSTRTKRKSLSEFVIARENLIKLGYDKTVFSGEIITPETVDELSLELVLSYVISNGSLYAMTDEQSLIKNIFSKWLPSSFSKFRFGSVLSCVTNDGFSIVSKPQLIISFHDLRNTIPIFDSRHVEGLAVDIRLFFMQEKAVYDVVKCCYLLSNYEENVLYIDGEELGAQSSISPKKALELEYLSESAFNKYRKSQKKENLKEAIEELKLKGGAPATLNYTTIGNSMVSFTTTSNSTMSFTINNSTATYS